MCILADRQNDHKVMPHQLITGIQYSLTSSNLVYVQLQIIKLKFMFTIILLNHLCVYFHWCWCKVKHCWWDD